MWTCQMVDFSVQAEHRMKIKENECRDKYLNLARGLKTKEHEGNTVTNCKRCIRNNPQRTDRNQRTTRDHPPYRII